MIRKYTPGSEWIYFKIYVARSFADIILLEISKIINKAKKTHEIEKFFFIRYSDPNYHLRLRILVKDRNVYDDIIGIIHTKLDKYVKSDVVWKIQIDTYVREIERYHPSLIEPTESLFSADSVSAIAVIKYIDKFCTEDYRWMICLASIDSYLSSFTNDINTKLQIIASLSTSFKNEFGFTKESKRMKELNKLYRDNRSIIERVLCNNYDKHISILTRHIKDREEVFIQIISEIKSICIIKKIKYSDFIGSYVHMNINRIIPAENRLHELVLYDFVKRFYEGEIARKKYLKNNPTL